MTNQHEITKRMPLLNREGNLTEPGWARGLLWDYHRPDIRASGMRIKEWDYYFVSNGHIGLALTIADNGYMGLDSVSYLDFDEKWEITKSPMRLLPMGKTALPETSAAGASEIARGGYALAFYHDDDGTRKLTFHMDKFRGKDAIEGMISLSDEPAESMVIATPFEKSGHFYYNQKINCMRASGRVELGNDAFTFSREDSFATLDWGRGVWTYDNTWYWGNGNGMVNGKPFGFNIGYGFGDTSAASENLIIYDGKAHKLDGVQFNIPADSYVKPWTFTSTDGRFKMDFQPVLDRAARTYALVLETDQHQVFGKFTGHAILDDGTVLELKDFLGFAEKVHNRY